MFIFNTPSSWENLSGKGSRGFMQYMNKAALMYNENNTMSVDSQAIGKVLFFNLFELVITLALSGGKGLQLILVLYPRGKREKANKERDSGRP